MEARVVNEQLRDAIFDDRTTVGEGECYGSSGLTMVGVSRPASNGAAVFWLLILMGLSTFAPCILLPEWRDYQAAKIGEQREQHRVEKLRQVVEKERRQVEAIQNDPTVVARLAQRDLGFRRPGETVVPVSVASSSHYDSVAELEDEDFHPAAILPPAWFSQATWWLPDINYDAIFCDSGTRPIVMLMSVSVIMVAAVLFRH